MPAGIFRPKTHKRVYLKFVAIDQVGKEIPLKNLEKLEITLPSGQTLTISGMEYVEYGKRATGKLHISTDFDSKLLIEPISETRVNIKSKRKKVTGG